MSVNDEPKFSSIVSFQRPYSSPTNFSNPDLDDLDDDDDELDEDSPDSIAEVQHILRTFGSNDCSPLSIDYYDSRRYEIMYEIMNMERQFDELKNTLYDDSILLIDRKLISIQNEEAPEYQDELKKLYNEMKLHLEIAKQRRQIEVQALENSMESELLSLEQTFENDKILLHQQIREEIEEQIEELETIKIQTQLCAHILKDMFAVDQQKQPSSSSTSKRRFDSSDSHRTHGKKRRLNSTGRTVEKDSLAIFYQISDVNVLEDCAIIQSSLTNISDESDNDRSDNDDDDDTSDTNRLVIFPSVDYYQEEELDCDKNSI